MRCPECGSAVESDAFFCGTCGYSVARRSAGVRYAGFARRVAATLIDLALLFPLTAVLFAMFSGPPSPEEFELARQAAKGVVLPESEIMRLHMSNMLRFGALIFFTFAAGWPYYTFLEPSGLQGTAGKLILRLKVTDLDGRRIGFRRANLRYFGRWLSAVPSCLGYLMPLFTERKQTLHDMLSGCLVLRR